MDEEPRTLRPAQLANSVSNATVHDLEGHRDFITELYQSHPLKFVIKKLEEKHKLRATKRQLDRRIASWNLGKKVKDKEMRFLAKRRVQRRIEENKESKFRVRSQVVAPEKVDRFMKRKKITDDQILSAPSPVMSNADIISVFTPSAAGSPSRIATPFDASTPISVAWPSPSNGDIQELHRGPPPFQQGLSSESSFSTRIPSHVWSSSLPFDFSELFITNPHDLQKALTQLGAPSSEQDRFLREEELYHMDLVMASEKNWGRNDMRTLDAVEKFAKILDTQQRSYATHMVYQRVLSYRMYTLGPTNPAFIDALCFMGFLLSSQGKNELALKLAEHVETQSNLYAHRNIILDALSIKSLALLSLGRFEAAEISGEQMLLIYRQADELELCNPLAMRTSRVVVNTLSRVRRHEEAVDLASLTLQISLRDGMTYNSLNSQKTLARALREAGRLDEAEEIIWQAISGAEEFFGKESGPTLQFLSELGDIFRDKSFFQDAENILRYMYSRACNIFGSNDYWTIYYLNKLAYAIRLQGDVYKSASVLSMLKESLAKSRTLYGKRDETDQFLLTEISLILFNFSRFKEAKEYEEELLHFRLETYGPEHEFSKNTIKLIQECEQQIQLRNNSSHESIENHQVADA